MQNFEPYKIVITRHRQALCDLGIRVTGVVNVSGDRRAGNTGSFCNFHLPNVSHVTVLFDRMCFHVDSCKHIVPDLSTINEKFATMINFY